MLLFLDFDGVLHSNYSDEEKLFCRVELLWNILRALPEVKVIFSTSWREYHTMGEMIDFVTAGGGEDLIPRFIGITPVIPYAGYYPRRDLEIQTWIDANGYSCHWIAIDDLPELFNDGHPNLYVVDGERGLNKADVKSILKRLQ